MAEMLVELRVFGVVDFGGGRAHSAFIDFSVCTSYATAPSSPALSVVSRIGQAMKSEYRLTISRIFPSAV